MLGLVLERVEDLVRQRALIQKNSKYPAPVYRVVGGHDGWAKVERALPDGLRNLTSAPYRFELHGEKAGTYEHRGTYPEAEPYFFEAPETLYNSFEG